MQSKATTPAAYIDELQGEQKEGMIALRKTIKNNIPGGFEEVISYGMIGYVVPHATYPPGYHCDPKLPLPFISIAAQKNFLALYHMGLYADPGLLDWFTVEYKRRSKAKIDMGKSCVRFKKVSDIPFDLIGELVSKITPQQWIAAYEKNLKK